MDLLAWVNFYLPNDAIDAYYLLQGCQIYEGCCELDLYFAIEFICGCKPYIPRYKLDYKPPRTRLIPWQLSIGELQGFIFKVFWEVKDFLFE